MCKEESENSMKIPSKKPHFFKPILPGFKNGIKIPIGFLKYLKGYEHIKRAVLKRGGKKWRIKLNEHRFEESNWGKFVEENDLQLGDLLVFRHEGNMEFEVYVFDSSQCDREYAEYLQEEGGGGRAQTVEEISKEFEYKEATTRNQSHVVCKVRGYCLSKCYFRLPGKFARANGLINKKCSLIIRDEKRRSWSLKLYTSYSQVYIGGRWAELRDANDIKEGDHITFKVVANGKMPIWEFHTNVTEKSKRNIMSSHEAFCNIEAAKDNPLSHPHFVCIMKSYYLSKCFLRVPVSFARLNGLKNRTCTITIRDKRRSWTFKLYARGVNTCIVGEWHKFCIVSCLKEGDYLMFEILDNGEKPILKFHDMRRNASRQPEGKKINLDAKSVSTEATGVKIKTSFETAPKALPASLSANDASPYFISIIKPYSIFKHFLYIPLAFAKSNGWMNRRFEMILMDEQQRLWPVRLGPVSDDHIGIHIGWQKFKEANDVQVGDICRFELINNEKKPVAYFHRIYSGKDAKQSP
ncbi:B3 domain-containing protein REM8-like isoform X1 [Solanum pennellii]|uniref:B3 domain-containing protein REM8-like isoform X1 n=2 Tax=Solanum pennellii TaxID=28526 RepID=A0ABM1HG10_SOLPN|nr:B3 domain-containing protein REM8-like isoform X1 [Solanum pennellii]